MSTPRLVLALALASVLLVGLQYQRDIGQYLAVHTGVADPTSGTPLVNSRRSAFELVSVCADGTIAAPDHCAQSYGLYIVEQGTSNATDGKTHSEIDFRRHVVSAPTQAKSLLVELNDASSGDGLGLRVNVYASGGAWTGGDEGTTAYRGTVSDSQDVATVTLDESYSSDPAGVEVDYSASSNDDWRSLGAGKLGIFTDKAATAVTVTDIDTETGVWTLSADPGDVAGRCIGLDAWDIEAQTGVHFQYALLIVEDENTVESGADPTKLGTTTWSAAGTLTAGQVRTRWMSQGEDLGMPVTGLDTTPGAATIYECAQIQHVDHDDQDGGTRDPMSGTLTFSAGPSGRNTCTAGVDCTLQVISYGETNMDGVVVNFEQRIGRGSSPGRGFIAKNAHGTPIDYGHTCEGAGDSAYGWGSCIQSRQTRVGHEHLYIADATDPLTGQSFEWLRPNNADAGGCFSVTRWDAGGSLDMWVDETAGRWGVGDRTDCSGDSLGGGTLVLGESGVPACIIARDGADDGWTACTFQDGAFSGCEVDTNGVCGDEP